MVADAEQQHLPVQLVDAPHRAVDAVRDLDRVRGGDARRLGPAAAKECGLSLRRTPGCRQKVSATTPISSMQGVDRGSKVLIVPRHAGHHQRARGAWAAWRAAINPAGPPSTGLTFEKAQGRAARRPAEHRGRGVGRSVGAEKWVALA